jgi:hypothetical protein
MTGPLLLTSLESGDVSVGPEQLMLSGAGPLEPHPDSPAARMNAVPSPAHARV